MSKLIELLLDAGVKPDNLHRECKFIAHDGYKKTYASQYSKIPEKHSDMDGYSKQHCISVIAKKIAIPDDFDSPVSAIDFIATYNLRNNPSATNTEQHQTIEQLIAQMDAPADMAKRSTMEQIRLRDLIAARLNPLGYCLEKK